jgi:predicted AlkP superfamily pyrophosphatase or phosphodiesterase
MINQESFDVVRSRRKGEHFTAPVYDSYSFAQIPQTIRQCLTEDNRAGVPFRKGEILSEKYDTVVLFFIDAFGWRFVERYLDRHPYLKRIRDEGVVNLISSQFPSTTAAHVTAIHTGLNVGQSGVYEWNYYEPLIDALISPLLFSYAGDHDRDTLLRSGMAPTAFFPTHTVYQDLANHGVNSYVLQDSRYCHSPYTDIVTNGARVIPYRTLSEAIATLIQGVYDTKGKNYFFLYYDKIDAICHRHGPNSLQLAAEIETFLAVMEDFFHPNMQKHRGRTLFLMTADHGQVEIDPKTTIYLNRDIPLLLPHLKCSRSGQILAPAGSPRDMFLHTKEGHQDEAVQILRKTFDGRGEIRKTNEMIAQGYFGSTSPSAELLSRIGDLVILPYANESVWWLEPGRFDQHYFGHHGGLTPFEMETVLLAQSYIS